MTPNTESQEWHEGFLAFLNGDEHYENPYGAHGQRSLDWHDGFETAQAEAKFSDNSFSTNDSKA